jgi:hypothetical protein
MQLPFVHSFLAGVLAFLQLCSTGVQHGNAAIMITSMGFRWAGKQKACNERGWLLLLLHSYWLTCRLHPAQAQHGNADTAGGYTMYVVRYAS